MTNDNLNPFTQSGVGGEHPFAETGGADPAITDNRVTHDRGYTLDDTAPVPASGARPGSEHDLGAPAGITGTNLGGDDGTGSGHPGAGTYGSTGTGYSEATGGNAYGADDTSGVAGTARHVAGTAKDEAAGVVSTAAAKAGDVKDVALDRGGDVAEVARDELSRLAAEAREQFQGLWDQASGQLREQATAGRQQLAGVLHDLADELGQMASKSDQNGPVTAFAKQASRRGGELSHWLSNADSTDVLSEIRRFARRRPFAFLAGATVAGVVVGRLSRGLMAGRSTVGSSGATRAVGATGGPAPRPSAAVPAYGGGAAGQTYGYDRAVPGGEGL